MHKATVVPLKYAMTHDVLPGRYELWATTEYGAIGKAPRVACDYAESHLASVRGSAPMPGRECYVFRHGQPVLFEIRGNGTDMPKAAEIAGLAARANGTSGTVGPSGSAQSASPTSGGYIASLSTAAAVVAGAVVAVLL
ncbi:hypothetical protein CC85DRAFT_288751 [Cutaneotrichosporon oleaginosum]|uniref:Uncharacterized protein n=1 Tax=Cutaneotrichosporon oleaginosum TaxID=879819 RepID=A0A0J0XDT8_9TREE|nr:uncharacterized protein CC85DRAFT_288751 [Cutaneotrichosporon oleaginosum]KLT39265.1 hypothetical protein CC85DRAFT_288751 [Cutaneotrichosporon oleaginosum]TXT09627.1 hypothetical protein COLE_03561 [Cutaneotrichosporon oleaginosum]